MNRGLFITLEGGDGAGKTTSLAFVRKILTDSGREVVVTREPGGTVIGEKIRNLLLHDRDAITADTETLLMFAARSEHLAQVVRPALDRGACVLCDRFTDATYAYQGGGRGVPLSRIQALEDWTQHDLEPDLTLLLDIPVDQGQLRSKKRGREPDRFEREKIEFFERVRAVYLARAGQYPARIAVIDASRDIAGVELQLRSAITSRLNGDPG